MGIPPGNWTTNYIQMNYRLAFLFVAMLLALKTFSQSWNKNSNEDLGTVDGIIHSLYDAISGPAGQDRNWNVFRNLFAENARMYIAVKDKDSNYALKMITPEQYAERNKTRLSDIGFNEDELYRITNTYGAGT